MPDVPVKQCRICGETKPLTEFYAMQGMRDGHRTECKVCHRALRVERYRKDPQKYIARVKEWQLENAERHLENQRRRRAKPETKRREREGYLRRKYGITLAEYDAMLEAQGGTCALCDSPPTEGISLHVDHDHATGEIRGLLCFLCNNALGDFDDDPARMRAAVAYLDRPTEEELRLTRERVAALAS